MGSENPLEALRSALQSFATERDWDQFHSPRNLASALSVEASEVLEHFQWMTDKQSNFLNAEEKHRIALELADVFLYLIRIADKLDVDLMKVASEKIAINATKYPVAKARGSAKKYTDL